MKIPLKTLFTIFVAPAIATAGQQSYLIFHFRDTIGRQPILTLSIPTPKGIREELDVTNIGNFGLFLVHSQEQLLLYKGNNVLICAFCRLTTLAENNKVISIADKFVSSTFKFLIQFVQYDITQNRTERTALRNTKLTRFITTAMDYPCIQIAMYQRYDTSILDSM